MSQRLDLFSSLKKNPLLRKGGIILKENVHRKGIACGKKERTLPFQEEH